MKKFKSFRKEEQVETAIKQGHVVDGVPAVFIPSPHKNTRTALLQRNIRERAKRLKEDSSELRPLGDWYAKNDNEHLGKDVYSVHDNLAKSTPITSVEKEHIKRYTDGSANLNRALFRAHCKGEEPPTHVESHSSESDGLPHSVHDLDNALHHTLEHDVHVYTGVPFNPGTVSKKHPEGHVHLPAYTSTSIDKSTAHFFSKPLNKDGEEAASHEGHERHIIHIHMKPGDRGTYVSHHSSLPTEREMLLPRHTRLKIDPKPQIHEDFSGSPTHIWHATIVHQPGRKTNDET